MAHGGNVGAPGGAGKVVLGRPGGAVGGGKDGGLQGGQHRLPFDRAKRQETDGGADLGCGLGDTLVDLSRRFPQATFVGVETAPLSFALAWLRCLPRRNCQVRYRDLWRVELGEFDVVYCFLSPAPMPRLGDKASTEQRAGSWLISNTFEIPGQPADRVLEVGDLRGSRLLLWRR